MKSFLIENSYSAVSVFSQIFMLVVYYNIIKIEEISCKIWKWYKIIDIYIRISLIIHAPSEKITPLCGGCSSLWPLLSICQVKLLRVVSSGHRNFDPLIDTIDKWHNHWVVAQLTMWWNYLWSSNPPFYIHTFSQFICKAKVRQHLCGSRWQLTLLKTKFDSSDRNHYR